MLDEIPIFWYPIFDLQLVDTAVDKIFPDADKKEEIKSKLKMTLIEQALTEKKLVFQDLQNARELYRQELQEKEVSSFVKNIRALVRPTIAFSSIGFYIGAKLSGINLTDFDYYLIGGYLLFTLDLEHLKKEQAKCITLCLNLYDRLNRNYRNVNIFSKLFLNFIFN